MAGRRRVTRTAAIAGLARRAAFWQASVMHRLAALLALGLAALPAAAQDAPAPSGAMSAAEFESYVEGRTLTFHDDGTLYGIEQYLPGRRVRWTFVGEPCMDGYWYAEGADICFVYDADPEPKCWQVTRSGSGLAALFLGADGGRTLYEAQNSDDPLSCPGPDVGV